MAISIAHHDQLTGALNRRGFEELQRSLEAPYALAFVDVDNLRVINKSHGANWEAGDRALNGVKRMLESISPNGLVVRWGGHEFLLCLPGFTVVQACGALNSLLEHPEDHLRIGDLPVTFSGGVAIVKATSEHTTAMQKAQQCAKNAKDAGRSRFLVAE